MCRFYLSLHVILLFSFLLWFLVVVVMFAIMEVCLQFEVLVFGVVVNRASSDEHVLFLWFVGCIGKDEAFCPEMSPDWLKTIWYKSVPLVCVCWAISHLQPATYIKEFCKGGLNRQYWTYQTIQIAVHVFPKAQLPSWETPTNWHWGCRDVSRGWRWHWLCSLVQPWHLAVANR